MNFLLGGLLLKKRVLPRTEGPHLEVRRKVPSHSSSPIGFPQPLPAVARFDTANWIDSSASPIRQGGQASRLLASSKRPSRQKAKKNRGKKMELDHAVDVSRQVPVASSEYNSQSQAAAKRRDVTFSCQPYTCHTRMSSKSGPGISRLESAVRKKTVAHSYSSSTPLSVLCHPHRRHQRHNTHPPSRAPPRATATKR